MRRARGRLLTLGLLAALVAHLVWWYVPRLHRGSPRGPAAALLSAPRLEDALWIAYPHQNLARLEAATGDLETLAGHLATLVGSDPPAWPKLGPWPVPPARALAWARGAPGEGELLALDVYPSVGVLARLAGRLAGNPWLAGGPVDDGSGGRVVWQDGTWILQRGGMALPEARGGGRRSSELEAATPELGWLRLGSGHDPWPAALYRLRRLPDGVELATGPAFAPRAVSVVERLSSRPVLLTLASAPGGHGAMVLLPPPPGGSGLQLPGAVLAQQGESGLELPGADLLDRIGARPLTRRQGAFELHAWDPSSLALGGELIAALGAVDDSASPPRLALWADLDEVAGWAEALGGLLQIVPFIDPQPARRWLALAALTRAGGPGGVVWAEIHGAPESARILLQWPSEPPRKP